MKRFFFLLILITTAASMSVASASGERPDRKKWEQEMKQAKITFMDKQLAVTDEQKEKFNTVYAEMQDELDKLRRETHKLRKDIETKKDASDLEYEKAAEAMFEYKKKEAEIDMKYFDRFKSILTKEQLFKFQIAETKWLRVLMKHRKGNKK